MRNGTHIIFCIQQRQSKKGAWLKLDSELKPVPKKDNDWSTCGDDYWGRSTNPLKKGGNWERKFPDADKQWQDAYNATGTHGWYDVEYAIAALKRIRDDDNNGMYDSIDGYGKRHQVIRHEFRIVKMVLTYHLEVTPATIEDLVESS